MTLAAARALLIRNRATVRYLSRSRSWRVVSQRKDGTLLVFVQPTLCDAITHLARVA